MFRVSKALIGFATLALVSLHFVADPAGAATCSSGTTIQVFNGLNPASVNQDVAYDNTDGGSGGAINCSATLGVQNGTAEALLSVNFVPQPNTSLSGLLLTVSQGATVFFSGQALDPLVTNFFTLLGVSPLTPLTFAWTGTIAANAGSSVQFGVTAVPVPPALMLFGTALAGLGFLGRNRFKRAAT